MRQSWVLVGILGGDQLSRAEDKQEYNENGATGLVIAQRDFLTYDGTCFTVTTFNGWIKDVPHSGFKVEVPRGIILHLVDEVTSWLPGDLVSSLPILRNSSSVHMSGVELKSMEQQILGSYLVNFHLAEDVDEGGGYEHPTHVNNLAITTASRVGIRGLLTHLAGRDMTAQWNWLLGVSSLLPSLWLTPRAVSTFRIANPNNNLIENAVAGAQDVGMWCLFHWVPTRQCEEDTQRDRLNTLLGEFHHRVHSNSKACWFVYWKRSKDNESLKIPGSISLSIMPGFQTMELDLLWQVMGLCRQTTAPAWRLHVPFLLETAATLALREAKTATGEKGQMENEERCPETSEFFLCHFFLALRTFPIHGFQIFDGSIRMARCTFKKFTLTVDRYSSAIMFFMINSWQISPQNNVPQILMEKSVGLKVFFGRPGQWFGNNGNENVQLPWCGWLVNVCSCADPSSLGFTSSAASVALVPLWLDLVLMLLNVKQAGASHPGQMPQEPDLAHCQSSIPFPSHVAARHVPTVPSLLSCSSRIKSSSRMVAHLKMPPWTPATSTEVHREHQAYYKMEERLASLEERMENIIWLQVNGTVLLFTSTGIFFVVLDACSGAVMGRQHFDTVTSENPACAVTEYVQTSVKERSAWSTSLQRLGYPGALLGSTSQAEPSTTSTKTFCSD
ncbi:hypothetical protein DV515_00006398 [Chloebia gouldiae]|uniref:CEMIP beta-helix domain-containing protein n=1 Tax=Chloebia gouldiae TaxID=44316 RepID=A0A3L8SKH8_CHLGU|nr:hypothetical protein DV515_00006398 [Chloebia gouldiae]